MVTRYNLLTYDQMNTSLPHIRAAERRLLTVLFVDIVKSSEILRRTDVEDAERIFREVITRQIDICSREGGTVNQVMGDGLMCLFGAEAPREDHALQALAASEKMIADIAAVREKLARKKLRIRIGINSGEVILQPPAAKEYQSRYQVVGEAVHIADRVTKAAAPDTFLVSETTRRLLDRFCTFEKASSIPWGAQSGQISLYRKSDAGLKSARPREDIIRPDDAAALLAHVAQPARDRMSVSWVQGDAGFGKSFIVRHVREAVAVDIFDGLVSINFYPHPVPGANGIETAIATALLPAKRDEWPAFITASAELRRIGEAAFVTACFDDILENAGMHHAAYHDMDKNGRAALRRHAVSGLLRQHPEKKRLLVVIEDLHWARREELSAIESILKNCAGNGALSVICTSRENPPFGAWFQPLHACIRLAPLDMEQSLRLLEQVRGDKPMAATLARTVCQLSGGNPYFIREYGQWVEAELKKKVPSHEISKAMREYTPEEIVNLLFSKLRNLDRDTISLARLASVQGMKIDVDMLAALGGVTAGTAAAALQRLEAEGILRTESRGAAPVFTHELLQKVIYNSLSRSARSQLHDVALRYLRRSRTMRRADARRMMAFHADCSDNPAHQYIFSKWAAHDAARLSQHTDALEFLARAKKSLARIKGARTERHLLKIHVAEIESLFITARYPLVKNRLQHVLARKALFPGTAMLRGAMSFQGLYLWINSEIRDAERTYAALLGPASAKIDDDAFMRESARLSHICIDLGEFEKAISHANNVLAMLKQPDVHAKCGLLTEMGPTVHSCLALAHAEKGDAATARAHLQHGFSLLAQSQDYFTRIYASVFMGAALLRLEDFEAAAPLLKAALDYCDIVQSPLLKPYAQSAYGLALAQLGDVEAGKKHSAAAIALARESGLLLRRSLFAIRHARVLMLSGEHAAAMKMLRRAIKSAVTTGESGQQADACRLIAECYEALPAKGNLQRRREKYFPGSTRSARKRA